MIPYKLHQTWKSKSLPDNFTYWRNSFILKNPKIEAHLYDDGENRRIVQETFPSLIDIYDSFPSEIFRVDFVRPIYMYKFGGIYADLDFQCLKDLSPIFQSNNQIILGRMGTDNNFLHSIPNAFMASRPNELFWIAYLAEIVKAWHTHKNNLNAKSTPEHITGPVVLKTVADAYSKSKNSVYEAIVKFDKTYDLGIEINNLIISDLSILRSYFLYPLDWSDQIHQIFKQEVLKNKVLYSNEEATKLFPKSFAVTYWAHTW